MFSLNKIQDHIEEKSNYYNLVLKRFMSEERYKENLAAIEQGLTCLGIDKDPIKVFQNNASLVIYLGRKHAAYQAYELPLFIGHKLRGLPIPEDLAAKCPKEITSIIEHVTNRKYINEFNKELHQVSLAADIFLAIHKSLTAARVETLLPDLLSDVERLGFSSMKEAMEKTPSIYLNYLSATSLTKLFKKISSFIRDLKNKMEAELKNIDLYSTRIREQLEGLYVETNEALRAIIENDVMRDADTNTITQKVSNLFSRLDRLFLGNIYHLKDYQRKRKEIANGLAQEEGFKHYAERRSLELTKPISELYDEYMFVYKFGPLTNNENKMFVRFLTQELEDVYRKKSRSISLLKKYEKRGLISVDVDIDALIDAYNLFMKHTIITEHIGQCFLNLVSYVPPAEGEAPKLSMDVANLKTVFLSGDNILTLKKASTDTPREITDYVSKYRKCVSILVYDIRGSSYMGIKLNDATKEQRIKYKFAKEMAQVVKKYGGFLLKDTGDGGLVWFSENSGSLYDYLYTESVTGKGTQLRYSICSGGDLDIIPASDAARRAILCARDMVLRAEEFVRANFVHYREWFADVAERTLELDGITYALLPPEFKSLFRIGVGIASGVPDRDVIFATNSYGDPDLVGPILSDANIYSRERQPGRSVIICDLPTVTNLILNIESFEYPIEYKDFEKYCKILEELRRTTHGYLLSDLKVSILPKGVHLLGELNKFKAIVDARVDNFYVGEQGNLYDDEKKRIKVLYEILTL
jgi:hypothetical protein